MLQFGEIEAAHIMSGMRYSRQRETATLSGLDLVPPELLEPPLSDDDHNNGDEPTTSTKGLQQQQVSSRGMSIPLPDFDVYANNNCNNNSNNVMEDENIIILEQLQKIARQSLMLGVSSIAIISD